MNLSPHHIIECLKLSLRSFAFKITENNKYLSDEQKEDLASKDSSFGCMSAKELADFEFQRQRVIRIFDQTCEEREIAPKPLLVFSASAFKEAAALSSDRVIQISYTDAKRSSDAILKNTILHELSHLYQNQPVSILNRSVKEATSTFFGYLKKIAFAAFSVEFIRNPQHPIYQIQKDVAELSEHLDFDRGAKYIVGIYLSKVLLNLCSLTERRNHEYKADAFAAEHGDIDSEIETWSKEAELDDYIYCKDSWVSKVAKTVAPSYSENIALGIKRFADEFTVLFSTHPTHKQRADALKEIKEKKVLNLNL